MNSSVLSIKISSTWSGNLFDLFAGCRPIDLDEPCGNDGDIVPCRSYLVSFISHRPPQLRMLEQASEGIAQRLVVSLRDQQRAHTVDDTFRYPIMEGGYHRQPCCFSFLDHEGLALMVEFPGGDTRQQEQV